MTAEGRLPRQSVLTEFLESLQYSGEFFLSKVVSYFLYSKQSSEAKGAFHLSELTGQPNPIVMRIQCLSETNNSDKSNPKYYAQRRWLCSETSWKKPILLPKCLVRQWSSRPVLTFGKRPKTSSSNYKRLEGSLLKCHIRAIVPLISGVRKRAKRNWHLFLQSLIIFQSRQ